MFIRAAVAAVAKGEPTFAFSFSFFHLPNVRIGAAAEEREKEARPCTCRNMIISLFSFSLALPGQQPQPDRWRQGFWFWFYFAAAVAGQAVIFHLLRALSPISVSRGDVFVLIKVASVSQSKGEDGLWAFWVRSRRIPLCLLLFLSSLSENVCALFSIFSSLFVFSTTTAI